MYPSAKDNSWNLVYIVEMGYDIISILGAGLNLDVSLF